VSAVLYNVARKPTIKPTAIPETDSMGVNIVLDANGERVKTQRGGWRTTSDNAKGYTLQTRPMGPTEWGDKLSDDIYKRHDYYFARVEAARLDSDLADYQQEL